MYTSPALIAFDIYDTCLEIKNLDNPYKQLFRDLRIVDTQKQLKNALITSSAPLEEIITKLYPEALFREESEKQQLFSTFYRNLALELDSIVPYPDTLSTLKKLKEQGYRIACVSNLAQPYVDPVHTQLSGLFDHEVFSCEEQLKKPDPALFQHLANISGIPTNEMMMVGNSLKSDVEGAKLSHMQGVLIDRENAGIQQYPGYLSISCLSDLLEILGRGC
ncbi:MAG: HAD family hydrolase [Candidatus Peribacteria bacterium]|jgi:putative hydrolase of the HAD superfamily|nr:HAD family hydrolase [Candidatus Peribacteria bacterium]